MENNSSASQGEAQPWTMDTKTEDKPVEEHATTAESVMSQPTASVPESDRAALVSSVYPSTDNFQKTNTPEPISQGPNLGFDVPQDDRPIPVVKVLSVRGVEYAMMSILLWIGAGSLIFLLTSVIEGNSSFDLLAYPISLLLVSLPGFVFFFLRLKAAELANPSLRLEASKRRFSQITQFLAFITCFFTIVSVVYLLVGMAGGNDANDIAKMLGSAAAILIVAGGIFYYYWVDEHKLVGKR